MLEPRDFPLLSVFVAVAKAGSFTGAAHRLRLGKSVVSQHIKTLEERLAARLIERSTRRLHLTHVGEQVLESAQQTLASFQSISHVLEGQKERPSGTLRVTCPLDVGLSHVVSRVTSTLVRQFQELKLELLFDDLVHDMLQEKLDVALRLNTLTESTYVVRRLGTVPEIIVGSPALFETAEQFDSPAMLRNAPWIAHAALRARSTWTFRSSAGDKTQVRVDLRAIVNSALSIRDLLLAGAGFAVLPLHMIRDDLNGGRLQQACPGWFHRRLTLHAVLPTRKPPPRVRAFLLGVAEHIQSIGFGPVAGAKAATALGVSFR